ncbi:MAG: nucleoside hydrolase [Ruminiclostridium sp.]|nr:nucleoside hydrolase [Ruminiclostridium sp.]
MLQHFSLYFPLFSPPADTEQTGGDLRKVIIDTDTGADDASALILAVKSGKLDILGVTTLVGNVDLEQSTRNALAALETAGSDAPVYNGSSERYKGKKIEAFSVFGSDGMGDAGIVNTTGKAEETDAIDFILETVKKYPNEVEIIALGPATNIAKAIEREPETMQKVKMIWSMGTAGFGHGNASPVAEFNTYADPDAYKIMLDSGINITMKRSNNR